MVLIIESVHCVEFKKSGFFITEVVLKALKSTIISKEMIRISFILIVFFVAIKLMVLPSVSADKLLCFQHSYLNSFLAILLITSFQHHHQFLLKLNYF